jgi:pyruvate kinase
MDKAQHLAVLRKEIVALRRNVAGELPKNGAWRRGIKRRAFAASALNFAHYLALRRKDLRELQRRLMVIGLSSLGRCEGHVLATLDAIDWALWRMTGHDGSRTAPSDRQFFRGERRLRLNTDEILGPERETRSGRIMVTLGIEAAEDPNFVLDLARRGADVVRINCGHDDADVWRRMIDNTRAASAAVRPMRILMDIAGPKVRMVDVEAPHNTHLCVGDQLLLTPKIDKDRHNFAFQATCAPEHVLDRLKVGDLVFIDDGKLRGELVAKAGGGFAMRITEGRLKGLKLKPGRSINFPHVDLGLEPLTSKDRKDLDFVARHADMIGYSFVHSAEHIAELQAELAARRPDWRRLGIVAKIETPAAVKNLPEIIVQTASHQPLAVMIARGDLAVEIGFERVAEMQQEILWLCEAAQIPAIWATQVLEGLIQDGMPSRGEMTDAAMAVQAECVMLNKGPNLGAGVDALDRLLKRMGENQDKKTPRLRALQSWKEEPSRRKHGWAIVDPHTYATARKSRKMTARPHSIV